MSTIGNRFEPPDLSPDTIFRINFFRTLNESNIKYCILRNYDELPYKVPGKDIDILTEKHQLSACNRIIKGCALKHEAKIIYLAKKRNQLTICVTGRVDQHFWGCILDFQSLLAWNGIEYYNGKNVLDKATILKTIRVAAKYDSLIISILNDALLSGHIKDRYRLRAIEAIGAENTILTKKLTKMTGLKTVSPLVQLLNGKSKKLNKISLWKLRASCLKLSLSMAPYKTILNISSSLYDFIRRRVNPPGLVVAVLGVDGSGKSTLIDKTSKQLAHLTSCEVTIKQLRPSLLPRPGKLLGKKTNEGPVTDPHWRTPHGFICSFFLLTYHTLDFIFGYWLKIFPTIISRGNIVMFDRYYHDYIIDPLRHRVKISPIITAYFQLVIPKPDIIIILTAPSKIIHARKAELSLDLINSQQARLRLLAKNEQTAFLLDSSKDIQGVCAEIIIIVLNKLANR